MEDLLVKYLTTGDIPLQLKMNSEFITNETKSILNKCKDFIYKNGLVTKEEAKLLLKNFVNLDNTVVK